MATETTKLTYVEGAAASTPAASRVVTYSKADGLMYSKDDAGVETLMSGGSGSGIPATIFDAKGDLIGASAADTAARLAVGTNGKVLTAASGETTGLKWGGGLYTTRRLTSGLADTTLNLNSTTYLEAFVLDFYHDWDFFPATHFLVSGVARSSESGQSVLMQLALAASPTNPISAGGDDFTIPFNGGAIQALTGSWIAVSDAMSGLSSMSLAVKGSNSTVDLLYRAIDIHMKIV